MLTRWDLYEMSHSDEPDELYHYGVKGMRWGKHLPGVEVLNAAIARARAAKGRVDAVRDTASSIYNKGAKVVGGAVQDVRGLYNKRAKAVSGAVQDAKSLYNKGVKAVGGAVQDTKNLYNKGEKAVNGAIKDFKNSSVYKEGSKLAKKGKKAANDLYKKSDSLKGVVKDFNKAKKIVSSYGNKKISEVKKGINYGANKASSFIKKYTGIKISKSGINAKGVLSKARGLEKKFNNSKVGKYVQLNVTKHF